MGGTWLNTPSMPGRRLGSDPGLSIRDREAIRKVRKRRAVAHIDGIPQQLETTHERRAAARDGGRRP